MNGEDAMERSYSCRMSKCAKLSDTKHRETEAQSFYFFVKHISMEAQGYSPLSCAEKP
jgi:hypothetical protein